MKHLISRSLGLGGALALLLTGTAATPALADTTSVDTSACSDPALTQPFASVRDNNWYALAGGQTVDNFDGSGWTLSGGAKVITTQLADGQSGSVLDLPSGSRAVSPVMCVSSGYATARTMVQNVIGSEGVFFNVSYEGTNTWDTPKNTGQVHGTATHWTLSDPVNVQPSNQPGWQLVRFTFIPGGHSSDFRIYNFYVDPRMRA
jgi:hypothetical protein